MEEKNVVELFEKKVTPLAIGKYVITELVKIKPSIIIHTPDSVQNQPERIRHIVVSVGAEVSDKKKTLIVIGDEILVAGNYLKTEGERYKPQTFGIIHEDQIPAVFAEVGE